MNTKIVLGIDCACYDDTNNRGRLILVMNSRKETIKLKVCVVGEPGCGKTSFIKRLIGDFYESVPSTE